MERLLRRAVPRLMVLLPPDRREFGHGLFEDSSMIADRSERVRWLAGGLVYALRYLITFQRLAWSVLFLSCLSSLVWINAYGNPDISSQYCLAILLLGGAVSGSRLRLRRAWIPGVVLGLSLPLAEVTGLAFGWRTGGRLQPASYLAALSLAVLVVPAAGASYAGAHLTRSCKRSKARG
jgi:hypothetical protein